MAEGDVVKVRGVHSSIKTTKKKTVDGVEVDVDIYTDAPVSEIPGVVMSYEPPPFVGAEEKVLVKLHNGTTVAVDESDVVTNGG